MKVYQISALQWLLNVCGHSELAHFVRDKAFVMRQVDYLPSSYNGDIVFELPPIGDDAKRGDRVQCMERAKDCYYWTHIVLTSANVLTYNSKNVWQFGKKACTGALQCKND
jgi:hypothetical protein